MEFQPAPDTAEMVWHFDYAGQKCVNVFHATRPGGWDISSLAELAGTWGSAWVTLLKAHCTSQTTLESCTSKDLSVENGIGVVWIPQSTESGSVLNQATPNSVTIAINWHTGFSGRSYRGRTYHIGIPSGDLSGNTLAAQHLGDLLAAYQALHDDQLGGLDAGMVVLSRYHNKIRRATAEPVLITTCSIDNTVDSQRRRLPGRGR